MIPSPTLSTRPRTPFRPCVPDPVTRRTSGRRVHTSLSPAIEGGEGMVGAWRKLGCGEEDSDRGREPEPELELRESTVRVKGDSVRRPPFFYSDGAFPESTAGLSGDS
eukprot:367933-Rhodomonas_salina.1